MIMKGNSFLAVLSLTYRQHSPPSPEAPGLHYCATGYQTVLTQKKEYQVSFYHFAPQDDQNCFFSHAIRGLCCSFKGSRFLFCQQRTRSCKVLLRLKRKRKGVLKLLSILKVNLILRWKNPLRCMGKSQTASWGDARNLLPLLTPKELLIQQTFTVSHLSLPSTIISLCPMDQIWTQLPFPPSSVSNIPLSCTTCTSFSTAKKWPKEQINAMYHFPPSSVTKERKSLLKAHQLILY